MFTKELYKITCTRNGETSDIGTYLLKPGPEAPMDLLPQLFEQNGCGRFHQKRTGRIYHH